MRLTRHALLLGAAVLSIFAAAAQSAIAAGEWEPNDSYLTAAGPLTAGTTYTGAFETSNDVDYFYFYVPQQTQLQFKVTNSTPQNVYICTDIERQALDRVEGISGSTSLTVYGGESKSGAVTLTPGKYYFEVICPGTVGKTYSFSLGPPGVTSTYEPFALACAAAHPPVTVASAALGRAVAKLQKVRQRLSEHPRWKSARKQKVRAKIASLKSGVQAARANYNAAAKNEQAACSVPQ
jgi:hypothetical protein